MIVVQAAAADDVFDEQPGQARAALRSIEQTGRDALRELRPSSARCGPTTKGPSTRRRVGSTAWTSSPSRCVPAGSTS